MRDDGFRPGNEARIRVIGGRDGDRLPRLAGDRYPLADR